MSSLLRRPGNLARYSKRVAECAAYANRPSPCGRTTQFYGPTFVNASRARRTYATSKKGGAGPPRDDKNKNSNKSPAGGESNNGNNSNGSSDLPEKSSSHEHNGGGSEPPKDDKNKSAAKGSNETQASDKSDNSNGSSHQPEKSSHEGDEDGSGNGKEEPEKEKPKYALNEDERAEVDKFGEWIKSHLPPSHAKEVDEPLERMKRHGIPHKVKEFMESMQNKKTPSLTSLIEFVREFSKHSWQSSKEEAESETKEMEEKLEEAKRDPEKAKKQAREQRQKRKRKQGSSGDKKDEGSQFPTTPPKIDMPTLLISSILTYYTYRSIYPGEDSKDITWQEFRTQFFDKGLVEKLIVFDRSRVRVELRHDAVSSVYPDSPASRPYFYYYFTIGSVDAFERSLDEAHKELGIPSSERIPVSYQESTPWLPTLLSLGPTLLGLGFLYALSKRAGGGAGGQGGIFGIGKSRAKKFNHETDVKVKFADVAGMDEAKLEIMEFVSFLKRPEQFQRLGAKIPRGAILSGPPGTGKTLLAKATAGESEVPFYSVSGSEFVEMFVGVGPSRVRDLFQTARKNTPCILFIDEIDAIGRSRSKQNFGGGNDERENTLNQILTEMDGFNTSDQVVVLAGTNRPDVLDGALLRPGRFDRHISIDRPTMEGRKQIFDVHLKKIVTAEDMEYLKGRLSALTPGFSGADIANCVNEAALVAARFKADKVTMKHFEMAIERVIGGLEKKSVVLSPEEKRTVAYHEAGHAICGWFFKHADPLLKVSIIPRGQGALGYAQYLPANGDTYLMSLHQLMDRMAMTLGGRVSEELHFDTVTSGASDDFNKVTRMATAMVTKFGMSQKIGHVYFDEEQAQFQKPFSEETARDVDLEVRRIVDEAYKKCHELLGEKKHEIGLIAEELLSKEMLSRDDLVRLLGPRPFPESSEFTKYFDAPKEGETTDQTPPAPPSSSESGEDTGTVDNKGPSKDGPQQPNAP